MTAVLLPHELAAEAQVERALPHFHLLPVDVEFLGHDLGQGRLDALADVGILGKQDDAAVAANLQEGIGREAGGEGGIGQARAVPADTEDETGARCLKERTPCALHLPGYGHAFPAGLPLSHDHA
ncbi:hypothetical protein LP420_10275 [Massilia sp. B-10]|nr:hypothetical protein LP420_10275 [Massilia sp. B-10]